MAIGSTSKGRTAAGTSQATGAVAITTGSTITIGAVWNAGATFSSLSDNAGNSYTIIGSEITGATGNSRTRFYRCENCIGNAALVATITVSSSVAITIFLAEDLAAATASALDQSGGVNDTASPYTLTAGLTIAQSEMLVTMALGDSGSNPATHAESGLGSSTIQTLAEETNGASFWTGSTATVLKGAGTYNPSWTETGASQVVVYMATLRQRAGGYARKRNNICGPGKHPGPRRFGTPRRWTFAAQSLSLAIDAPGNITFAGQSITASLGLALSTQGSIAFQGQSVTPALTIPITGGSITFQGQTVTPALTIPVSNGSISFQGLSSVLALGASVTAGSITFNGQDVTLANATNLTLDVDPGSITFGGQIVQLDLTGLRSVVAAGSTKHRKRRQYVEIDGQQFEVSGIEEARALLQRARAIAERQAEERAAKAEKVLAKRESIPRVKIKKPDIRVPEPMRAELVPLIDDIKRLYARAAELAELRLLMLKAEQDDEEDELFLLL